MLCDTLARAPDSDRIRVFAYGSLMWNPCFEPAEAEPARLRGYRRRFCILTVRARGSPECPGLGPGLVPGAGECCGIAYRLNPESLVRDMEALFEREMNTGVYRPAWLEAESRDGRILKVLSFVVEPAHPQYTGELPVAEMVDLIAGAKGRYGSCRDYLANMVVEMSRLGAVEPEFEALLERVDARISDSSPGG